MSSIIIAFPAGRGKLGCKIREVLSSHGFDDLTSVTNASEALQEMNLRTCGVLISCVRLPDMYYRELLDCLPDSFSLLLLDGENSISSLRMPDVVALTLPIRTGDLVSTVRMMDEAAEVRHRKILRDQRKSRSEEDRRAIDEAKLLLMDRNRMSEPEAYRYIQKTSMDTGRTMPETARMILLFDGGS